MCDQILEQLASHAILYLSSRQIPKNAVAIFDIDQTLIDLKGNPTPIVKLFNFVKIKGIHPVIITARDATPESVKQTQQHLQKFNIFGEILMYFRPPEKMDLAYYKYCARKNVHERGFIPVLSIGDEYWDIGEYGGYGIKLPKCG